MIYYGNNSKQVPLEIVGSNTFGRYPKISVSATYNMYESDGWLVPYPGYVTALVEERFSGGKGRGLHNSPNWGKLVVVIGSGVYFVTLNFDQVKEEVTSHSVQQIGSLQTSSGVVYIAENNKPQILISDNHSLYYYDSTVSTVTVVDDLDFTPGYIDFHDTYFLCAQVGTSNWRISSPNEGSTANSWGSDPSQTDAAAHIAALETKPDKVQAVVRFPSRGNMIFVFGECVTEAWFDVGAALFPYQRQNAYSIDYGCMNPETIATIDNLVVWLSANEKAGPVIMYSEGQHAQRITTDGIDFLLSNLQNPADASAFLYRQDGHIFYHINFHSANLSLVYDFNNHKFYYATDENRDVYIADQVAFYKNQYYFISKQESKVYAIDTVFTTYDGKEIPRIRVCPSIRLPNQDYFIAMDAGFTIESGSTDYIYISEGPIFLITQDEKRYITQGDAVFLITEDDNKLQTEDENFFISEQAAGGSFAHLISEQEDIKPVTPRIGMSVSIDGGEHFSSYQAVDLPAIGQRKNKLMWWQLGAANDLTCQFRFYGIGRFVANNGFVSIRQ